MIRTANLIGSVSRKAGGLFESVRGLVHSLAASGMQVRVLGLEDEFTGEDLATWDPVGVSVARRAWPGSFGYAPGLGRELEKFSPDLAHTHGLWMYPSVATSRYCQRTRTPYVVSAHGMLDGWALRNSRWKKLPAYWLYEQTHLRNATCLRALCEPEARAIRALGLRNPIAIIPNGIDLPALTGNAALNDCGGGSHLKPQGRKVLLYLGRLHPKKGLMNLLRAWARVGNGTRNSLAADWILTVAGWDQGGHEAELKQLATELGIRWAGAAAGSRGKPDPLETSSSVVFLGPQFKEAKGDCYRSCDAFILPSLSEGLPMVVLEAWAYGKPVLMTPECNLSEGFAAEAAIRIEPTVAGIEAGLRTLFCAPGSSLANWGERGRGLVRERFAWPHIGSEMKRLYEWILGGGPKPKCIADI